MVDGYGLFVAMATQWRIVGHGAGAFQSGLDYSVLRSVAADIGIKLTSDGNLPPAVFADVRTLESEALRVWSAKR